jgi:putative aldouronate transport system substrate-binding protein
MKKTLAFLLVLIMLLSVLTACTRTGDTLTPTQAPTGAATSKPSTEEPSEGGLVLADLGAMPLITSGEYTLTIGLPQSVQVTDYYDNYLTNLLQEKSGLNFEFVFFPSTGAEAIQKLELMVSANQELPDIITAINVGPLGKLSYGTQGVYLALDEYLETDTHWLEIAKEKYLTEQEKRDMYTYYTSADGHIYGFPYIVSDPTDDTSHSLWINHTWLSTLGLEMPKTTEDFYNVLTAFKNEDPNGNGTNDEIPFIGSTAWVSDPTFCILSSFIYFTPVRLNVENGVISAPYVQEEYREGLRYLNRLVSEDLLSPLSFTQDGASHKAMLDLTPDQDSYVGVFSGHPHTKFAVDSLKRMEYTSIPPLTGPGGVCYSPMELTGYGVSVHITRDAKNPQLVFRFLDMMCQDDLSLSVRFGKEGDDWRFAEPGDEGRTEKYSPPVYWTSNLRWTTENNVIWNLNAFNFLPKGLFGAGVKQVYDNEATQYRQDDFFRSVGEREGKQPEETVNILIYTEEEQEKINELETNIKTYEAEQRVLFITGGRDIENEWDDYINELKAMGLDNYLEIVQTCYDRMFK